ncbi:MAG: hypothetical protein AAFY34_15510 [Pseudomonadota bacterium]
MDTDIEKLLESKLGLEPLSVSSMVLFEKYANNAISYPVLVNEGTMVFSEACDLLASENYIASAFLGYDYEIIEIDYRQYKEFEAD